MDLAAREQLSDGTPRPPGRRHLRTRVRSLLMVVVLIPTVALAVLTTAWARANWETSHASAAVEADACRLEALMSTRSKLTHEEVNTMVLLIGKELGASPERLTALYGVDFERELRAARADLDADETLQTDPIFEGARDQLRELRSAVDTGAVTSEDASDVFAELGAEVDERWTEQFDRLDRTVVDAELPGAIGARLEDLEHTHEAFLAGLTRTGRAIDVLGGDLGPAVTLELIDADARFRTRAEELDRGLGPRGAEAWAAFGANPAAQAFEETTAQTIETALTGARDPAWADPSAHGRALFDGVGWSNALIDVVEGASADLSAMGEEQRATSTRAFQAGISFALLLTVVSLVTATIVARSVTRPLKALASNARSIREGRLDVDPVDPRGPKELADTAAAFNEMLVALTAVEARAVAMAEDPEGSFSTPIPGRTGEALDRAFDLLRESIQSAEASRAALQELATRDGMTGLLNRTAALEAIDRELTRMRRDGGGAVVVVFVDVDGLKEVNDTYGHDAGDSLIRLAADTLRHATRDADVLARYGGDEFVVAGRARPRPGAAGGDTGTESLVQRLAAAVAGAELDLGPVRVPLRASLGVALDETGEVSAEELVRRADVAMYRAKQDPTTSVAHEHPSIVDA